MNTTVYKRSVSQNEKNYINFNTLYSSFSIQFLLEGTGVIDELSFKNAVTDASCACPGIRSRLCNNYWVDSELAPSIYFIDSVNIPVEEILEWHILKKKLDPCIATAEIYYCRSPFFILFRIFHGIMDAKGALIWISNVFKALRNEQLTVANSTVNDQSFLGLFPRRSFPNRLRLDQSFAEMKTGVTDYSVYWKRITLKGNYFGILAKVAKTITDQSFTGKCKFLIPVDMRRHMPGLVCTANLTLPIFPECDKSDTWEVIFGKILECLKNGDELNYANARNLLPRLLNARAQRPFIRLLKMLQDRKLKHFCSGVISHAGKIDFAELSLPGFSPASFYLVPTMSPMVPFVMQIIESNGRTELLLASYNECVSEQHADRLLLAISGDLNQ